MSLTHVFFSLSFQHLRLFVESRLTSLICYCGTWVVFIGRFLFNRLIVKLLCLSQMDKDDLTSSKFCDVGQENTMTIWGS